MTLTTVISNVSIKIRKNNHKNNHKCECECDSNK